MIACRPPLALYQEEQVEAFCVRRPFSMGIAFQLTKAQTQNLKSLSGPVPF